MRAMLLLLTSLAIGCASGSSYDTAQPLGTPGLPIDVEVGSLQGRISTFESQIEIIVRITNMSDHDVVIDRITIDPSSSAAFELRQASITPKELIDDGEDHDFHVPTYGKLLREVPRNQVQRMSVDAEVRVMVDLQSGEKFYGTFSVPIEAGKLP